jgi:hypothetical protein
VPMPWQEPVGSAQNHPLPQSTAFVQLVPMSGGFGPPPELPPGSPGGITPIGPELELLPDVEPVAEPELLPEPAPRPPASPHVAPFPASPRASLFPPALPRPSSPPHPARSPEDTSRAQAARRARRAWVERRMREFVVVFTVFQFC